MKEGFNPDRKNRSILLRLLRDKRLSTDAKQKIIEPMRGNSDEEKEKMAAHLILEITKYEDKNCDISNYQKQSKN